MKRNNLRPARPHQKQKRKPGLFSFCVGGVVGSRHDRVFEGRRWGEREREKVD